MVFVKLPDGYLQQAVKIAVVNTDFITGIELAQNGSSFMVNVYINGFKQYMYEFRTYEEAGLKMAEVIESMKDAEWGA